MMKKRIRNRKTLNIITILAFFDVFIMMILFRTSSAIYVSDAVSKTELEVALYAFNFSGVAGVEKENDTFLQENTFDVSLGDIGPGETKYYKFKVYNTDADGNVSDTNISYDLKIISTTNLRLNYDLYYNQNASSSNAVSLIDSNQLDDQIMTDSYGTYFRVFTIPQKCFKYDASKYDEYTLKVTFPQEYSDSNYQDLVESIKIQMTSKQVLNEDNISSICR